MKCELNLVHYLFHYLQRTNPTEKKLLEVLDCIWGGPSPLTSNIPKRLLQTACELVPEASQLQSAGNYVHPLGGGHIIFAFSAVRRPTWFSDILGNGSCPIFTKFGMQVYWVNSLYGIAFGGDSSIAN